MPSVILPRFLVTPERHAFWNNRSVFVTGGFGLIGSAVTEQLVALGARVTLLSHRGYASASESRLVGLPAYSAVTFAPGNLEDGDSLRRIIAEYEVDTVIQLAFRPIAPDSDRSPLQALRTNVFGNTQLLEACRINPTVKRVVLASSDKVYGSQPVASYDESAPFRGRHPFDVSAACVDLLAQMYFYTYKLPVAITRCGNLYGPGDVRWQRLVAGTFRSLLRGQAPQVRSNGGLVRDYLSVHDAANAYLLLAENLHRPEVAGQAFNIASGTGRTALEMIDLMRAVSGREDLMPQILDASKQETPMQAPSSEKARRILGWKPLVGIEEGLQETWEWYRAHIS